MYGPTAFLIGYAKGITRSVLADRDVIADLIPVDFVVNAVISASVETAVRWQKHGEQHTQQQQQQRFTAEGGW